MIRKTLAYKKPSGREADKAPRLFKTKWFNREARKAGVRDDELREAAVELSAGQGDNLGGNVWKKRLNSNMHRGIVVEKIGDAWFFVFLFAKKDRENIEDDELAAFKLLAKQYAKMTDAQIATMLESRELLEIVKDDKA